MTVSWSLLLKTISHFTFRKDWRDVPLFTALSLGATSFEADVWLINGTLFVGLLNYRGF